MTIQRYLGKRERKNRAGEVTGTVWRARYIDDRGREHSRVFPTKKAGNVWLDDAIAALLDGTHVAPKDGDETLKSYYEALRAVQVWETGTVAAMNLAVLSTPFADHPLRSITTSMVQAWIRGMDDRGLEPSTIRTRFHNLRRVLRAAVVDRRIPRDPCIGVRLPATRKREASMVIPAIAEVHDLLDQDTYWTPLWAVCAFAGLRLGEAAALRPEDIDFLERKIHVRRQVQRGQGGQVEIRLPKYGSERSVDVPDELLLMLAHHMEIQPHRVYLFGIDTPPHQNTVGHHWRRAKKSAGITRALRLHDLRHFFASGLIAAGCDVVTVQKALGHAKATTTLNTYSHLWPDAGDRIRAAAGNLWKQTRDDAGTTGASNGAPEHETGAVQG